MPNVEREKRLFSAHFCRKKGAYHSGSVGFHRLPPASTGLGGGLIFFTGVLADGCFHTGHACVSAHLGKKGGAQADESRLVPLNPAKNLVCEKIYFSAQGSWRMAAAAQSQELRGTPRAGLFAGMVGEVSKGAGIMGTGRLRCEVRGTVFGGRRARLGCCARGRARAAAKGRLAQGRLHPCRRRPPWLRSAAEGAGARPPCGLGGCLRPWRGPAVWVGGVFDADLGCTPITNHYFQSLLRDDI
jgi:hypothetical protein